MYAQVIRGKVGSEDAMRARMDAWDRDCRPGATGWLGATMGFTPDGTYVNLVRFESEAAAKANADRAEQGAWWSETEKVFDGPVTFYDCPRVELFQGGGSDDAGFVQVMIFKPSDVEKVRALNEGFEKMSEFRPDLIGGLEAITADGTMVEAMFFTSEAAARKGESQDFPDEVKETFESFNELAGDVEYIDLAKPILMSP